MSSSRVFNLANISFNAIRENKILAKISEFTWLIKGNDTLKYLLGAAKEILLNFVKILLSMTRKYHNHTRQNNPRHHEEEQQNTNSHKTSGITTSSNDCKPRKDTIYCIANPGADP